MKKLWILQPNEGLPNDNPWKPWYDKAFGFVVRANTEDAARQFAHDDAGDENRDMSPWLDPKYTSCIELSKAGDIGIVLRDFAAA